MVFFGPLADKVHIQSLLIAAGSLVIIYTIIVRFFSLKVDENFR
jgi:hypothetical protein